MEKKTPRNEAVVDAELSIDDVSWNLYHAIERLAPFGEGNPKPLFHIPAAEVLQKIYFGKTKNHLKLVLRDSRGRHISAIQFFADKAADAKAVSVGQTVSLRAHLEQNVFRNKGELRLRIIEV